jgi:hypothetical protein
MKMTSVLGCSVNACAFNEMGRCHAMAVTIGGPEPCCDTFMDSSAKGGVPEMTATVGACKVANCMFNDMMQCSADNIAVAPLVCTADCLKYKSRGGK